MNHREGSMEWSVTLVALLLSNIITFQTIIKNKTKMMLETFSEMSQKSTTKYSLDNQVIKIKKKARTQTFGIHLRQSPQKLRRRLVTGVLLLEASNRIQIHLKLHHLVHLLAPELELRHTEEVRTLWEEQMAFHLTGEEAAASVVAAEVPKAVAAVPKMTTGAEITISHG
jgi:hypothetical protein